MSREHLGVFDTPAGRRHTRLGFLLLGLLLAVLFIVVPLREIQLGPITAFVPTVDGIQFVDEVMISVLLYAQGAIFRSRALAILASGYLFSALLLLPHALTFPGAFSPDGLLGATVNTAGWLANARRISFPATVILYLLLKSADRTVESELARPPIRTYRWIATAMALAALATALTTAGHDLLPPMFIDHRRGIYSVVLIMDAVEFFVTLAAIGMLLRKNKSVLELWLLVAMVGWLGQFLPLDMRFTVGWYYMYGVLLVSNLIVMVALIAESNSLYMRLALTIVARDREREGRLMSMDAVAAAVAHEIGQPLAGINLMTTALLRNLTSDRPDPNMAVESARATLDAVHLAFGAVKSVRAMYSKGVGQRSPFNLNDLLIETTSAMEWGIKAHKISLRFDLDPELPLIEANKVQMQRVLANLITNSIESLAETNRSERRIAIRTARTANGHALLEVADTGIGIPTDKLAHVFEPFVTTKKTGSGLGLALCRAIVEEHGGRLWASPGKFDGVTFHLQIPHRSVAPA